MLLKKILNVNAISKKYFLNQSIYPINYEFLYIISVLSIPYHSIIEGRTQIKNPHQSLWDGFKIIIRYYFGLIYTIIKEDNHEF